MLVILARYCLLAFCPINHSAMVDHRKVTETSDGGDDNGDDSPSDRLHPRKVTLICIDSALALVLVLILSFCIFSERFVPCCNRCFKKTKKNPK